jgi:hypothetical protein
MEVMRTRTREAIVIGLVALIATAGCGGDGGSSGPTQPTTPPLTTTEQFTGTIAQGESDVHPLTLLSAGDITVQVISLMPLASLGFYFGVPSGNICLAQVPVGTITQGSVLVENASSGEFCIQIYDGGQVQAGAPISYVVNVQHP